MWGKPVVFSTGPRGNRPEDMQMFFREMRQYDRFWKRSDFVVVGFLFLSFAAAIATRFTFAGFAGVVFGLVLEIAGAMRLATGVLKLELQPVGTRVRYQTAWHCTYWGFKTERDRRLAVANRIQRGGKILFWGFVIQILGVTWMTFAVA